MLLFFFYSFNYNDFCFDELKMLTVACFLFPPLEKNNWTESDPCACGYLVKPLLLC